MIYLLKLLPYLNDHACNYEYHLILRTFFCGPTWIQHTESVCFEVLWWHCHARAVHKPRGWVLADEFQVLILPAGQNGSQSSFDGVRKLDNVSSEFGGV